MQFEGDEQHDAIEFLNVMMDALHEDLKKTFAQPSIQRNVTTVLKNTDYAKQREVAERRWQDLTL